MFVLLVPALLTSGCDSATNEAVKQLLFTDATSEARLDYAGPSYTAAVADVNGDGWPDLAFSQHGPLQLLVNRRGRFDSEEILRGDIHGLAWIDWNNDALPDLYVSQGGNRGRGTGAGNALFLNRGGELVLTEIEGPARNTGGRGRSATPWDIDNDGHLELFVLNFATDQRLVAGADRSRDLAAEAAWRGLKAENLTVTRLQADGPVSYLLAGNMGARILQFDDDGRLADVTRQLGVVIPAAAGVSAIVPSDVDNDGDQDLYLVLINKVNQAVEQVGRRVYFKFTDQRDLQGGLSVQTTGRIAVEIMAEGARRHAWGRFGDGSGIDAYPVELRVDDERLRPPAGSAGPGGPGVTLWRDGEGLIKLDFEADSQSIQATTGWIEALDAPLELVDKYGVPDKGAGRANRLFRNEDGRFVDVTAASGLGDAGAGQDAVSADFDNDGDLDIFVLNGRDVFGNGPNMLYENQGDGVFVPVAATANVSGTSLGRGSSVVEFDYDRDGDIDLFVTNGYGPPPGNDGPVELLRNDSGVGNWLQVTLRASQSNSMALGARVILETDDLKQTREVIAATGRASVSWRPVHFGMAAARHGNLTVEWPGGARSTQRVKANSEITVTEPRS